MCLMLCAPLDWQYAELLSSASDAVLCSVLVRKMWVNRKRKNNLFALKASCRCSNVNCN